MDCPTHQPPIDDFRRIVAWALDEDLPDGDPTGAAIGERPVTAALVARRPGTVAGLVAVPLVLEEVSQRLGTAPVSASLQVPDGTAMPAGGVLGMMAGPARSLLAAERTVLNVLGHLSGVATATAAMVSAVAGTRAVVRDTRKTLPGLRAVEKYAVRCGGGENHRMSLSDAVLVKDNHIAALGGVRPAVEAALQRAGRPLPVEVEVDDLDQLEEALDAGARLVLVDNFALDDIAEAVRRADLRGAKVEASGGITLSNVGAVAACGVHYVAVGALTHSAPALDIGLDMALPPAGD